MNFSDERYVRVYTRDTLTWKLWHWETRSVFMLLVRKVDRSGVLDTDGAPPAFALAALVEVPQDVAERALAQLVSSGTAVITDRAIVLPKFLEAQEATQSDRLRQQESRSRRKAAALATTPPAVTPVTNRDDVSRSVTERHELSRDVTPAVPCRAVPAVPTNNLAGAVAPPPAKELFDSLPPAKKHKPPAEPEPPPDSEHQAVIAECCAVYERIVGAPYALDGRDAKAVKALRGKAREPLEVYARWELALRKRDRWPSVKTLPQLDRHWNEFPVAKGAA